MSRDTLTRIQQAALELIREHRPVYRYGPLTPSLNRPKPVKPGDLTPMFSHGLHPRTVLSLERLGLVRLEPVTPEHGRVVAVDTEEQS